jgi:hypothetical protein
VNHLLQEHLSCVLSALQTSSVSYSAYTIPFQFQKEINQHGLTPAMEGAEAFHQLDVIELCSKIELALAINNDKEPMITAQAADSDSDEGEELAIFDAAFRPELAENNANRVDLDGSTAEIAANSPRYRRRSSTFIDGVHDVPNENSSPMAPAQLYSTMSGRLFHSGRIAIVLVGLPARGKT